MAKSPLRSVVFLVDSPAAPDPRIEKEGSSLVKAGFGVQVIGWDQECSFPEREEKNGFVIRRIRIKKANVRGAANMYNVARWNYQLLLWLIRHRNEYDIIHACNFDTVVPALVAKLLFQKKVVYDIFDMYADSLTRVSRTVRRALRWAEIKLIGLPDAVIIADECRLSQISGAKPRRIIVIYNSPPELVLNTPKISGNVQYKLSVGYAGHLIRSRGIFEAIDVVKKHPEFLLVLAGSGPDEDQVKRIAMANENVKFLGHLRWEEALALHATCDAVLATYDPSIPNNRYSSANKLFEAMMGGVPVIVAKGTGMDRIVKNYDLGFVVEYGDESQLENAFSELARWDTEQREDFKVHARDIYRKFFAWEIMEQRLVDLYKIISFPELDKNSLETSASETKNRSLT